MSRCISYSFMGKFQPAMLVYQRVKGNFIEANPSIFRGKPSCWVNLGGGESLREFLAAAPLFGLRKKKDAKSYDFSYTGKMY